MLKLEWKLDAVCCTPSSCPSHFLHVVNEEVSFLCNMPFTKTEFSLLWEMMWALGQVFMLESYLTSFKSMINASRRCPSSWVVQHVSMKHFQWWDVSRLCGLHFLQLVSLHGLSWVCDECRWDSHKKLQSMLTGQCSIVHCPVLIGMRCIDVSGTTVCV